MDEGFGAVRIEANKVLAVVTTNRDSANETFGKIRDETKCE